MPEEDGLRVVFTGHTGLNKENVLTRLADHIFSQDNDWCEAGGLSDPQVRKDREQKLVGIYDAEEEIDIDTFLIQSERDQKNQWRHSFLGAMSNWRSANPKPRFAFISLHLTYQAYSEFFSPLAWKILVPERPPEPQNVLVNFLREFKPHYFVTLIDNVHVVQKRIRENKYDFRLVELLRWRNVETLMTDILAQQVISEEYRREDSAKYPFEHSPVVAVRHPRKMLFKFLSEPELPRIYAAYPISKPREIARDSGSNDSIDEINRFREFLHDRFTVFDPVTIDERPMQLLLGQRDRNDEDKLSLPADAWWPTQGDDSLSGEALEEIPDLLVSDVKEIATDIGRESSEIDRQIRSRDFRLIDQADCVVVYRPTYRKKD